MNISQVVDNEFSDFQKKESGVNFSFVDSNIDMLKNGIYSDSYFMSGKYFSQQLEKLLFRLVQEAGVMDLFSTWNTCYVKNQAGKFTIPQALIKKPVVVVTEKIDRELKHIGSWPALWSFWSAPCVSKLNDFLAFYCRSNGHSSPHRHW